MMPYGFVIGQRPYVSRCSGVLSLCPSAVPCQCSFVPLCERDNQKNRDSVIKWQDYWTGEGSSQSFTCFFNQQRR